MKYARPYLVTSSGELVLFKFIESINYGFGAGSDPVINKLKDDIVFEIVTVSGARYFISINYHIKLFFEDDTLKGDLVKAIIDQWLYLNRPVGDT